MFHLETISYRVKTLSLVLITRSNNVLRTFVTIMKESKLMPVYANELSIFKAKLCKAVYHKLIRA